MPNFMPGGHVASLLATILSLLSQLWARPCNVASDERILTNPLPEQAWCLHDWPGLFSCPSASAVRTFENTLLEDEAVESG